MSVKQSTYIEAPVEKVFDFYSDPRKSWSVMPDQMVGNMELTDVKRTKDGVGTYYSWAFKVGGLRLEGFNVFTDFVPNKRITDRCSRSFVGTWTTTFEPEGSGTRVTDQRHPTSFWPLRAFDLLFDRFRVALDQKSHAKLKAALEKPTRPAAVPAAGGRRSAG